MWSRNLGSQDYFLPVSCDIDTGIVTAKVPSSWLRVLYLHLIGLQEVLVLLMAEILMCKQRCMEVNTGKNVVI